MHIYHLNTFFFFFSDQGRPGNRWRPSPLLCEFVGWILRPAPYCFALGRGLFNPLTSAGGILNFQDLILCLGRSWLSPEEFVALVKNIPRMISLSISSKLQYFLCSSLLRHGSPFDVSSHWGTDSWPFHWTSRCCTGHNLRLQLLHTCRWPDWPLGC